MLDLLHLPVGRVCDVQIFRTATPVGGARWVKPRGCSHVWMLLAGAGNGGGGGASGLTLTQRGGGGGGSHGVLIRGLIPSILLPDYLILTIGAGGVGGAADADATAATATAIYWPTTATVALGVSSGTGGLKGTSSAGGSGGAAGGSASIVGAFAQLGLFITVGGTTGRTGSATTTPAALAATFFSGGGGGAGVDVANTVGNGGDITSAYANFPNIIGGTGNVLGGNPGGDGLSIIPADLFGGLSSGTPLFCTGGAGGGADGSVGVGGKGGDGGQCCGGGGGGGGVTGGAGGRGGDGLAIFVSF